MTNKLKGKVAIVTGSGQGIGKAIAIALAAEGARVMTNNRSLGTRGGDAESTAHEIRTMGHQAMAFFGDVASFDIARNLIETTVEHFGGLDILVNNAATMTLNPIWNLTEQEWDTVVNSALKGTFNCIRHACGLFVKQRWGRVINTTSVHWLGTAERSHYGAAKAGIVGLTRCVAKDIGMYGVTCNAYRPVAATRVNTNPEIISSYKKNNELGLYTKEQFDALMNPPKPETVPPLLVYLCTDEASDINGQVFDINGNTISIYTEPVKRKSMYKEGGLWTLAELTDQVPKVLLEGYKNPAPADKRYLH